MIINPRCYDNSWLFRRERWDELRRVYEIGNSTATPEREEDEKAAVAWIRDHPRRPLGEWSDLADAFEPASWTDWSPVRSVKLATAGTKPAITFHRGRKEPAKDANPEYSAYLANRRERKQVAKAVAALLTGAPPPKQPGPKGPRLPKADDIPQIRAELAARMDACS